MKHTITVILLIFFLIPLSLHGQTQKNNGIIYAYDKKRNEVYVKGVTNLKIEQAIILDSIQIKKKMYKVTRIGDKSFKGCSLLKEVTIPNTIIHIGNSVFQDCNSLVNIQIPNSVKTIFNSTFEGCTSLQTVVMSDSVSEISLALFENCTSLTSINIPHSVTVIESHAFSGCSSLMSISIPESVESIEYSAFEKCTSLTNITIPESVESIGFGAFSKCSSLTSITIPNSVKSIGFSAFSGCNSLTDIDIPLSITVIEKYTFMGCNALTSVTIPNSVRTIGESAFVHCKSLKSVIIPNSVDSIGKGAFSSCPVLESVILPTKWPKMDRSVFEYSKNIMYVSDDKGEIPSYADWAIPEESPWGLSNSKNNFENYVVKAEQGDAEAQYELGQCYSRGKGVNRDQKKALYWLTKSAEQEYVSAQFALGLFYQYGKDGKKDLEKAVYWYIKAENNGCTIARRTLKELKVAPYYQKIDGWTIATTILQGLSDGINTYNEISQNQKTPQHTNISTPNSSNEDTDYGITSCKHQQERYNSDAEWVKKWMEHYKNQWVTYYRDKAAGKTGPLYSINVTDELKQIRHFQNSMKQHRKICPSIPQSELETITPKAYIKKHFGLDVDY